VADPTGPKGHSPEPPQPSPCGELTAALQGAVAADFREAHLSFAGSFGKLRIPYTAVRSLSPDGSETVTVDAGELSLSFTMASYAGRAVFPFLLNRRDESRQRPR